MQPQEPQLPLPPPGRTTAPPAAKPLGQALSPAAHLHGPQYTQSFPPLLGSLLAITLKAISVPCVIPFPFHCQQALWDRSSL